MKMDLNYQEYKTRLIESFFEIGLTLDIDGDGRLVADGWKSITDKEAAKTIQSAMARHKNEIINEVIRRKEFKK